MVILFAVLSLLAITNGQQAEPLGGLCGIGDDVVNGSLPRTVIGCFYNNPVASIKCSFDGGEPEECSFPLILTNERFSLGDHSVVITATDNFGQTFSVTSRFTIKPPILEGYCGAVGGEGYQQTFHCSFSNPLSSVTCTFDFGVPETCSPSVGVHIDRFGLGPHILLMTATDVYGQIKRIPLTFQLREAPPYAVGYLSVAGVTSTSFRITWSPSNGGRPATSYQIQVLTLRGILVSKVEVGSDRTSYVQTGLSPRTIYIVNLRARNSAGLGNLVAAFAITS